MQCKDKTHLRNHMVAHFYTRFDSYIPAGIPFACPECGKENRDRITLIRHFCWAHNKFELVTGLSEDELRPRGVPKAMASGTRGTRASTSQTTSRAPPSSRSSPSTRRRTPTTRNSRVSITRVHEEVVQIEGEAIEGEIILDDLSFDILEALKNVDEVKEEEDSSSKKRKTRNSFTNRIREVVVDEDSEEEYSPPKVRF